MVYIITYQISVLNLSPAFATVDSQLGAGHHLGRVDSHVLRNVTSSAFNVFPYVICWLNRQIMGHMGEGQPKSSSTAMLIAAEMQFYMAVMHVAVSRRH